ncbi:hypothetical protein [Streptomyces niveus]|uniref:hypothetical protein n=1 Tax=Streptomyces niveus TaxID=193462 RepID=UPI00341EDDE9
MAETRADDGRLFLADGRRVPDVRLAEGDARIRVRVLEWNRRSAVRVARTAGLRGSTRSAGTRWASLTRATGTSQLRLDDWWTAAARWNEAVLERVAQDMPRLRERAVDALADPPDTP